MEGLLSRYNRGVRGEHEADMGVLGHQAGLELGDINVQGTIKMEMEGGRERTNNLSNQMVQVGVHWPFNVEVAKTGIVKGFVVEAESTVRVLSREL
jgi:hypothetical protein